MDKIRLALAFCDPKGTYCQHAAVTIASVFANTKSAVCIYVLHDETLTDENKEKLTILTKKYNQEIVFIPVSRELLLKNTDFDIDKVAANLTYGSLFRLLLPNVLKEDKILYFDCDVICAMDIKELWDIDLRDKAVAVVPDLASLEYLEGKCVIPKKFSAFWSLLGIKDGEYFNSGVLSLNLAKIRQHYDLLKECSIFLQKYKHCTYFPDQDFLNCLFANDKIIVSEKFNRIRYGSANITNEIVHDSIWHLAGLKPWDGRTRGSVDELYWYYFSLSPYGDSREKLIAAMYSAWENSKWYHRHSHSCLCRLVKQMKDNLFRPSHIRWISTVLLMPYFKIKQKLEKKN